MMVEKTFKVILQEVIAESRPVFTVKRTEYFPRMFDNFSPEYNSRKKERPLYDSVIQKQSRFYVVA